MEILNGDTAESYGDVLEIRLLGLQGNLELNDSKWPDETKPLRVLLIYSVPASVQSIKLSYWGKDVSPSPVQLSDTPLPQTKK